MILIVNLISLNPPSRSRHVLCTFPVQMVRGFTLWHDLLINFFFVFQGVLQVLFIKVINYRKL